MIACELTTFKNNADDPDVQTTTLLEVTDWGGPFVEVRVDTGKQNIYLKFRMSDLRRELKELKEQP